MIQSPLATEPLLSIGVVSISTPVVTTWVIMIALIGGMVLAQSRLSLIPTKFQVLLELLVTSLDTQIRDTMQTDPAPYRALIGTLFVVILACNWSGMIPGVEPPRIACTCTFSMPRDFKTFNISFAVPLGESFL